MHPTQTGRQALDSLHTKAVRLPDLISPIKERTITFEMYGRLDARQRGGCRSGIIQRDEWKSTGLIQTELSTQ